MQKKEILDAMRGNLVVSCQALEQEPLHGSSIMVAMAKAALEGGASAIRANSPSDIRSIRAAVRVPLIGLYKRVYPDSDIYITPTIDEIEQVVASGADIVAMDATRRVRPGGKSLEEIFASTRQRFPDTLFMADCSTEDECLEAQRLGFDIVGTTLRSYTEYTESIAIPDFDFYERLHRTLSIPFIAEGGIWEPEQAARALRCGAFCVVVGSAITRPQLIARRFSEAIAKHGERV